ncbi:MAG TPA: protein kinase [Isosphaeraceae bacterium]|jgi:predicted Ser/Thr protein kinase|nr:protein kinase [Isosphaeraceae bacterium]
MHHDEHESFADDPERVATLTPWGTTDRPPPEVPGFEILRLIGKGGMGEVYVAQQATLRRLVALKFIGLEGGPSPEEKAARFRREAEIMAKVSHPNVLAVFDYGVAEGRPYLVLEYVEGGDLRRRLRPGKPLPLAEVLEVVRPVGEALAHLHRQGILHRDLKPENILMHEQENPKVADFGIAVLRAGAGPRAETTQVLGTVGYVAPEQQYHLKVDERADQFSLAAIAYEMLTGHKPLGMFKPPSSHNPKLGPAADAVLLRALEEEPKDRFATVLDFVAALEGALRGRRRSRRAEAAWMVPTLGSCVAIAIALAMVRPGAGPQRPAARAPAVVAPPKAPQPDPKPKPKRSALFLKLTERKAVAIWKAQGSPTGAAGKAVELENWYEAERRVEDEVGKIAYRIWEERGRATGAEGDAQREANWEAAERRLYKQTTGEEPPPRDRAGAAAPERGAPSRGPR